MKYTYQVFQYDVSMHIYQHLCLLQVGMYHHADLHAWHLGNFPLIHYSDGSGFLIDHVDVKITVLSFLDREICWMGYTSFA